MARPHKKELFYFTLDVAFYRDIKIRMLLRYSGGPSALGVLIAIFSRIYESGYYLEWNNEQCFTISTDIFSEDRYVAEIVEKCLEYGIFDKKLYEEHHILTSHDIQERYLNATIRRTEKPTKYIYNDLIKKPKLHTETELLHTETELLHTESTQSKVKKSKDDIESSLRSDSPSSDGQTTDKKEEINFLGFMDFFNRTMQENKAIIATITDMTKKRREAVAARARTYGKESLEKVVVLAATSAFLNGENDKSWVADFNWLFKPNNFVKVLEGNYNHDLTTNNSFNYGPVNKNGYRSREDIISGSLGIIQRMSTESPKSLSDIPVV